MAFDFPNSPTVGQLYPATVTSGQPQYKWDGRVWAATGSVGNYVLKTGDTMSGQLSLPTAPAPVAANAARKDYVDAGDTAATNVANAKLPLAGGTVTGNLGVTGNLNVNGVTNTGSFQVNSGQSTFLQAPGQIAQAGQGSTMVQSAGGGNQAFITFHDAGQFACNFGLSGNGNFYMGGWSHGTNVAYQFWTTRDFTALPVMPTGYITGMRLAYIGDVQIVSSALMTEPYSGSVVSGATGVDIYNNITLRYRQVQVLINGGWAAIGYA